MYQHKKQTTSCWLPESDIEFYFNNFPRDSEFTHILVFEKLMFTFHLNKEKHFSETLNIYQENRFSFAQYPTQCCVLFFVTRSLFHLIFFFDLDVKLSHHAVGWTHGICTPFPLNTKNKVFKKLGIDLHDKRDLFGFFLEVPWLGAQACSFYLIIDS